MGRLDGRPHVFRGGRTVARGYAVVAATNAGPHIWRSPFIGPAVRFWEPFLLTESNAVSPIYAGLLARCPKCGKGQLFKNVLELREDCKECGLNYRFVDSGDGPAVFAIFILGFLVLGLALYVEFTYEPAVWVHVVLWGAFTPLFALGLLRFLKALLIALQYKNKAEEGRLAQD